MLMFDHHETERQEWIRKQTELEIAREAARQYLRQRGKYLLAVKVQRGGTVPEGAFRPTWRAA